MNLFGTGWVSPQSLGRKERGRGHCVGKVPLGERVRLREGRVKGPSPDGLLTLWCPATGNDHPGFPLYLPPHLLSLEVKREKLSNFPCVSGLDSENRKLRPRT